MNHGSAGIQLQNEFRDLLHKLIKAGWTPPSIAFGVQALLNFQLLLKKWTALLAIGGSAQVMIYQGPSGGFGPAVQAAAGSTFSPPLAANAQTLVATVLVAESDSVSTSTLQAIFGAVGPKLPASASVSFASIFAVFLGPLAILLAVLTAQVSANLLASLNPTVILTWPTAALSLEVALTLVASLTLAASLGIQLPTIAFTLDVGILLILSLEAVIQAALSFALSLAGSALLLVTEGPISSVGADLSLGASGTPGNVYAVVFLVDALDPVSVASLEQSFRFTTS